MKGFNSLCAGLANSTGGLTCEHLLVAVNEIFAVCIIYLNLNLTLLINIYYY